MNKMVYVKSVKKMIIVSLLSLCIMTNTVYSDVQAASVVIGGVVLTAGEAFALLMATLGVSATTAVAYQNRDTLQAWGNEQLDSFCSWMAETDEIVWSAQQDVEQWALRVVDGGLSTSNDMWRKFKKWISSIYLRGVDEPVIEAPTASIDSDLSERMGIPVYVGLPDMSVLGTDNKYYMSAVADKENDYVIEVTINDYNKTALYGYSFGNIIACVSKSTVSGKGIIDIYGTVKGGLFSHRSFIYWHKDDSYTLTGEDNKYRVRDYLVRGSDLTAIYVSPSIPLYIMKSKPDFHTIHEVLAGYDIYGFENNFPPEKENSYALNLAVSNVVQDAGGLDDVDIVGNGSQTGVQTYPLNLPSAESLPDALSDLSTGASTLEEFNKALGLALANLSGSTLITDNPDDEKPISDITTEIPVDMKHFIVDGLAELFPFCLPFDFIDFVNVLCAEPQAPRIEFPIKYPAGISSWGTYMIEVDLSVFDSVAEIMRDIECLLFIVGLIVITRSYMIRG